MDLPLLTPSITGSSHSSLGNSPKTNLSVQHYSLNPGPPQSNNPNPLIKLRTIALNQPSSKPPGLSEDLSFRLRLKKDDSLSYAAS